MFRGGSVRDVGRYISQGEMEKSWGARGAALHILEASVGTVHTLILRPFLQLGEKKSTDFRVQDLAFEIIWKPVGAWWLHGREEWTAQALSGALDHGTPSLSPAPG